MDDAIQKGYQLALVSLVCQQWQRLMVAGQRYTGRTLSAHCLQTAVMEMEAVLGARPQRRVGWCDNDIKQPWRRWKKGIND